MAVNEYGQPVGESVDGWTPRPEVVPVTLVGAQARVEPLTRHHLPFLYESLVERSSPATWTYLPYGPFADQVSFTLAFSGLADRPDVVPHALCDATGRAVGSASYQRWNRTTGVVEISHVVLAEEVRRTRLATEALYLMIRHVFDDLGYRRCEWKCDALNEPSRRAAERLGFTYEGTFLAASVYKGRNRDTAWFGLTAADWPARRATQEAWLAPSNFDSDGRQRTPLAEMVISHRETEVP